MEEERRPAPEWRYLAFIWKNDQWHQLGRPYKQHIDAHVAAINAVGHNPHLFQIIRQKYWPKPQDILAGRVTWEKFPKRH